MPNKDAHHNTVLQTLRVNGWRIIREHALLSTDTRRLFIDIWAERLEDHSQALFEVKGFDSPVESLASALGKYQLYQFACDLSDFRLPMYLAVPKSAFDGILNESIGVYARQLAHLKLFVFVPGDTRIIEWT